MIELCISFGIFLSFFCEDSDTILTKMTNSNYMEKSYNFFFN